MEKTKLLYQYRYRKGTKRLVCRAQVDTKLYKQEAHQTNIIHTFSKCSLCILNVMYRIISSVLLLVRLKGFF